MFCPTYQALAKERGLSSEPSGAAKRLSLSFSRGKSVEQVVVSGPKFGTVSSLEDLGGKEPCANPLTVQYKALKQNNDKLRKEEKPPIAIKRADKYLIENHVVQMVNAGLIPATVTSASRAKLWSAILHHLTIHTQPAIASGEQSRVGAANE